MRFQKILWFFVFLPVFAFAQSEKSSYHESYIDMSVGIGANHGMYGLKTVIGYKGSGLYFGIGADQAKWATQIGVQLTYRSFFINLGQGVYSHHQIGNTNDVELVKGMIFMGGSRVNLNKNKSFFLELGLGYGSDGRILNENNRREDFNRMLYSIGVGFKIG